MPHVLLSKASEDAIWTSYGTLQQPGIMHTHPIANGRTYQLACRKEGAERSLIPVSQLGRMDGIASTHPQHDILSRHSIMYLLTRLLISPAMTHEKSAASGEHSFPRTARAGHSRSLCLSSPKVPVGQSLHTHLWRARRKWQPSIIGRKSEPMQTLNFLQLCNAHGVFPVIWTDLICWTRKPEAVCAQLHASSSSSG